MRVLAERGVRMLEGVEPTAIERDGDGSTVTAPASSRRERSW